MPLTFEDYQKTIARIYQTTSSDPEPSVVNGTGFLVSSQYLLTCAHVVTAALDLQPENLLTKPTTPIVIDFPIAPGCPQRHATVVVWQPCLDYFRSELVNAKRGEDICPFAT
ncbi:MAG: hypothetical protein AAGG51_06725 [Cyanobacteria bacterium P01_G01_bin.54]